uniref:MULE transposase domain-containing protein n=1 Tax=Tanacetum cinerariifolium TaxID=118510 RepID=A0A6L2P3C9_TANCI|nr:hypothetical protein [Tanacetum cinerariifolium]
MVVFDLNQPASSLSEENDVAASNSHVVSVAVQLILNVIRLLLMMIMQAKHVYDSLDECIEMYRKYASEAGFDPKKNDRQVRPLNFRVCGCKACVVFDMVPHTTKYTLTTFDVEHNHELDRIEYKHLSKAERRLTYNEQLFIIKAANANIGARHEFTKDFSFDYFVEDAELCGLFWVDELAKCNYKEFGDIVSFDATYKTNKYAMVFVPFMAIDNHRRSVTVGSRLLKKETSKAYGWLLRAFKKAFVRAPNIVATHQDETMRLAVATEFPESKHRLCMWHIMQKIPSKIPAFFVDSPLCGLMRTTSRSKSENSFLSYFTSSGSTLVKFMLCYESAMKRQRHTQEKLDHPSFDSFLALLTPLPTVEHASKVYTRSLFIRVHKEIVQESWLCLITCMSSDKGCTICIINEEKIKHVGLPEVIDKESTSENVEEEINVHKKVTGHYKEQKNRYGEKNEAIEKLAMEAFIILDSCVHMLRNNEPKFSVFVNKMKAIKSELEAELPIVPTRTVYDFVQEFMGVKKPDKVKVKNPIGVRPKGREKQKRIKSGREISRKKMVVPGSSGHVDGGLRDGAFGFFFKELYLSIVIQPDLSIPQLNIAENHNHMILLCELFYLSEAQESHLVHHQYDHLFEILAHLV